jgi:hypothetical protein
MSRGAGWQGWAVLITLSCGHPDLDGFAVGDGTGSPGSQGASGSAPAEPTESMNCGGQKLELDRRPADLVLVLDRSGSMLQNLRDRQSGRFVQKWTEVVGALDAVVDTTQSGVAWGLKLYPLPDGCGVPDGLTVPVALDNHAAVLGAIRSNVALEGSGGSPMREALRKAAAALTALPSASAKYLVLATDGLPTCQPGLGASEEDRAGAIAAVSETRAAGIPVFIMGIATETSPAHETLNQMAAQGGRARKEATAYYPVGSRGDLVAALQSITGQIYACTFRLDKMPPAPDNVTVEIDGVRVPRDRDHAEGWDYGDDARSLLLHGQACERLKAGQPHEVQVLYGCR